MLFITQIWEAKNASQESHQGEQLNFEALVRELCGEEGTKFWMLWHDWCDLTPGNLLIKVSDEIKTSYFNSCEVKCWRSETWIMTPDNLTNAFRNFSKGSWQMLLKALLMVLRLLLMTFKLERVYSKKVFLNSSIFCAKYFQHQRKFIKFWRKIVNKSKLETNIFNFFMIQFWSIIYGNFCLLPQKPQLLNSLKNLENRTFLTLLTNSKQVSFCHFMNNSPGPLRF